MGTKRSESVGQQMAQKIFTHHLLLILSPFTAFLAGTICLPIDAILAHSTDFPVLALNIRLTF